MEKRDFKIVVTGDICLNTHIWTTKPADMEGYDWQTHKNLHIMPKIGGAMLLAEMVKLATGLPVKTPKIADEEFFPSSKIL